MRTINKIIVHCSASDTTTKVSDIYRWHVVENGWDNIGYHVIIDMEGQSHRGRPLKEIGAHCYGHNKDSIGVCLIGGKDQFDYTQSQLDELRITCDFYSAKFSATVHGHNEFSSKLCPRFDVRNWYYD